MTAEQVILLCGVIFLAVVTASLVGYLATRRPTAARLLARLEKDLPELQSEFFASAIRRGLPHGLTWKGCDWEAERCLAHDRTAQETVALVQVRLELEPTSGTSGAERENWVASAILHYTAGRWQTLGKAIFKLRPSEVLVRMSDQYEPFSESRTES